MKVAIALFFSLSLAASAQTVEVTDSGTFAIDASGRYLQLEGPDGVIVEYLYDTPNASEPSGARVRVNAKLALTVRHRDNDVAVAGLPRLSSVLDFEDRTTAVLADGKAIARFEYTHDGYFAAVTVPGALTWKTSAPDNAQRVRQAVKDASDQIVTNAVVTTHMTIDGIRHDASYEAAAEELGVRLDRLTYEVSPTGALTTARDPRGRVAFYVVHIAPGCDVGFSPDGKPRFYDLSLSVLGGEIAPGGDLVISEAWEGQRGTFPDHLVLTARGAVGLYAYESANGAIEAAWTDLGGKVYSRKTAIQRDSSPRQ